MSRNTVSIGVAFQDQYLKGGEMEGYSLVGAAGTAASPSGGNLTLDGGIPLVGGGGNGGSVYLRGAVGDGSGVAGITALGHATGTTALALGVSRSTITNAATITDAQIRSMVLYQDASGGSVTMTTRTGAQMDTAFPAMVTGRAIPLWCASNHASNTSTISGGSNVTLVGSGAVTQLGGSFLLIKTGTGTYDLVRVG